MNVVINKRASESADNWNYWFVGPYLAKKLLSLGYEVYGLFRRRADGNTPRRLVETGIVDRIKLVEGDLTDLTSLLFVLDKVQPHIYAIIIAIYRLIASSMTKPRITIIRAWRT
jgi:GDPmannose 4,6-dehydratase